MMEEGLSTSEVKFQRLNSEVNADDHLDRISNLPDEIIQYILSLLRMKDVVRTSVLSRRWHFQWMFVNNLDFSEFVPSMNHRSLFMDFVDRVIALRKPLDINHFALACEVFTDDSRINSWVCYAVKHNVQHLCLVLRQIHLARLELPHCLFTCITLRKVVILADIVLELPSSIHFSNLKLLTLQCVVFRGRESAQQLFSGLPVLEELTLERCCWGNVKTITIALPMLKKFEISENLAVFEDCQFFIIAKNLKSLNYIGTLKNDYYICDSVSLSCGAMGILGGTNDIGESSGQRKVACRAGRLLKGISCVEELLLTTYAFEILTYSKELVVVMPVLNKLTRLGFLLPGNAINFGCGTLTRFLQKLPCLELLIFNSGVCLSGNHEEGSWILEPVPSCFSSHLKYIKINKFCGTEGELQVVKSLLKHAEILWQMDIICHHNKFSGELEWEKDVLKQIQMLPRASTYGIINLY